MQAPKKPTNTPLKFFLYARKSTDDKYRQVASVESQIEAMEKFAKEHEITIIDTLQEKKSAKAPGRPIFNSLLERIHAGEAQGILCWKLDRLARNPVDGGNISWMLQQGIIQCIQTHERSYYPSDNVLMMQVELGMANQYIRDLASNVKRELTRKASLGMYPTPAPPGYINDIHGKKGLKQIKPDPERFHLVRKMFDLMLTGNYSVPEIARIANEEWGYRTRTTPTRPSGQLARTTLYRVFTLPMYYGQFEYGGNLYQGTYDKMISTEEYDRVQVLLGRKGRPRPKSHIFEFTGMIKCGECGSTVTAEQKVKRQKNGNVHHYVYYHCTKKRNRNCTQKCLEIDELKKQVNNTLESLQIPQEFHEWGMRWFRSQHEQESTSRNAVLTSQQKRYTDCVHKIDGLIEMRASGLLTDEEFTAKKWALYPNEGDGSINLQLRLH